MKWYDLFSKMYDKPLEKLYYSTRSQAVSLLKLQPTHTLLDVACGTGANFPHFKKEQPDCIVFGTDFSSGMLKKAQNRIAHHNWSDITLFPADATQLNANIIKQGTGKEQLFDCVICVLGLSVIPNWKKAFDNMLQALKKNGTVVVVDVFAEKRNFNTWLVEKIARADLKREIWQTVKEKTVEFKLEFMPVKENKVGGKLFIAVGKKA